MSGYALNKDSKRKLSGIDIDGTWTGSFDYVAGIDLSGGDVTLTTQKAKAGILEVDTGHASNAIIISSVDSIPGKVYVVVNNDSSLAANIKISGGTAVSIAATKTAIIRVKKDGSQVLRVTADT